MAQIVAAGYDKVSVQRQFNARFAVTKEDFQYRFMIRNVSKEDEATYLCQAGTAYEMSFTDGTVLIVNGNVTGIPGFVLLKVSRIMPLFFRLTHRLQKSELPPRETKQIGPPEWVSDSPVLPPLREWRKRRRVSGRTQSVLVQSGVRRIAPQCHLHSQQPWTGGQKMFLHFDQNGQRLWQGNLLLCSGRLWADPFWRRKHAAAK